MSYWTKTLIGLAAILYILHNDWWFWNDPRFVLGLPIGLCYHLLFCLGAATLLFCFIYFERRSNSDSDPT